jgi:hypothetical protein
MVTRTRTSRCHSWSHESATLQFGLQSNCVRHWCTEDRSSALIQVTGTGVLENEQQRGHDNDGRDDLPSGGASLFHRRLDSSTMAMAVLFSKAAGDLCLGRSPPVRGTAGLGSSPPKG